MKYFRLSFLLFVCAFLIVSCQKELSYEAGLGKGTLKKGVTGECLPVNVNGTYQKDTLLGPIVNFVDIQISVSELGSYSIKTDTINGYSFNGAGFFNVQGLNTVRLIGSGKPIVPGVDMFTVKFDTSVCQFNVTVTGSGGGGGSTSAVFTLVGSPTNCTGATQTNNFYATVPTNTTSTVNIKVDVTAAGTYTISTPLVNGISFSATGNLATGSNQTIALLANGGTPTVAGSFPYPLTTTAPASNCGFNLTVQAAPTPATYTFQCPSNPTFSGTYQVGVSTSGDSVRINVTSVAGGSYNITTSTTTGSNGVTFTGSGVLTASPNPQSVTLFASGTPASAGPFTYTLTGAGITSTCTFTQTYSTATTPNGTITFKVGTVTKTFNFSNSADTSIITPPPPAPPGNYYELYVTGDVSGTSSESFNFNIIKSSPYFTNGSMYTVNQLMQAIALNINYTDSTGDVYSAATDGTNQSPAFSITITSINAARVVGTFSGPLKNTVGTIITAMQGTFDLPLQ